MPDLPNSIGFQIKFIQSQLDNWAKGDGGIAVIAKDWVELWELSSNSPGPRCVVVFDGEEIRGSQEWAAYGSRVDRRYVVLVSRGEGFTAHRADALTQPLKSGRAFYELVEEARDIIRVLFFDASVTEATVNNPVDYHGIEAVTIDGYPIDAYLIRFSIGTQLGMVQQTNTFALTGPPNPPSDLNLTDNGNSVTLNWTNNSANVTATQIQRSDDGVTFSTIDNVVGASITTYTDITVSVSTMYFYRVYCNSSTGDSQSSNVASIFV